MGNRKSNKWVSTSDVGRASYCPHYLELKRSGARPSQQAILAREKGEIKHEALNRQAEDKRCYVASHLYGIDDQRTGILRSYRDRSLANHLIGRVFIRLYYSMSPSLVVISIKVPAISKALRSIVDLIVARLQEEQND